MMNTKMQRRGFLKLGGSAIAATAMGATLNASANSETGPKMIEAQIDRNHGHLFTVDLQVLLENGPQTYSIQGASRHPHTIDIDEVTLEALAQGQDVELESSVDRGHAHAVVLSIA